MGLKGSLTELPLPELIEMTSIGGKTGRLVLFDEEGAVAGELAFRAGRLVGAFCGELVAERAFYALLGVRNGSFDFDPAAAMGDENCNLTTATLLIEGMRRLDELHELRRTMPAPARVRYLTGEADDEVEGRVLGYLGPGARALGDIVEGILVGGESDEYDALLAVKRLSERGVVRVEAPLGLDGEALLAAGPPRPELER